MNFDNKIISQYIAIICIVLAASSSDIIDFLSNFQNKTIAVAIPAFVFVIIFRSLSFLYEKILWKFFYRENILDGYWCYLIENKSLGYKTYGRFYIEHTFNNIRLYDGKGWYRDEQPIEVLSRGVWHSQYMFLEEKELLLFYNVILTRTRDDIREKSYSGVMKLQVDGLPVNSMHGIYKGLVLDQEICGSIMAAKLNKKVPDKEIPNYIKNIFGIDVSTK